MTFPPYYGALRQGENMTCGGWEFVGYRRSSRSSLSVHKSPSGHIDKQSYVGGKKMGVA